MFNTNQNDKGKGEVFKVTKEQTQLDESIKFYMPSFDLVKQEERLSGEPSLSDETLCELEFTPIRYSPLRD